MCKAPAWHTTRTLTAVYHTQHRKPRGAGRATAEPLHAVNAAERKARINLITPSFIRDTFSCPSGDKGSCEGHPTSGLLLRTRSTTAKRPRYPHRDPPSPLQPMRESKTAGAHCQRILAPCPAEDKIPFKQVYLYYQFHCLIFYRESL